MSSTVSDSAAVVPDAPVWALALIGTVGALALVAVVCGIAYLLFNFWWKRV